MWVKKQPGHGTIDWFQTGKGVCQGCILSPCLFNLYAEYLIRNAVLEEAQAGIKIAGRNINSFRYAEDTTLMAESERELKSHLMKVKDESEKVGLNLNIQKTKIMASGPIISCQIDGETVETVTDFILGGSKWHPTPVLLPGKTIALTRWTFVGKVMSLIFNMLFSLVITFLSRSKRLLISSIGWS